MDVEKFFKGLLIAILGYFVVLALFFAANASVFTFVTSKAENVKQIISDSGVYDDLVPSIVSQALKNSNEVKTENRATAVILDNSKAQEIFSESFDQNFIQTSVEKTIDGLYAWLNGATPQPEVNISLKEPKEKLINVASNELYSSISDLPACTYRQLASLQEVDVLNPPCSPPGITKKDIKSELTKQLNDQKDGLIAEDSISLNDLKTSDGQPIFNGSSDAPDRFQAAKWLPLFLVLISTAASVGIFLLSSTRSKGLKVLGILYLVAGVFTLMIPGTLSSLTDVLLSGFYEEPVVRSVINPLLIEFNNASKSIYYIFGGVTMLLGGIGLFFSIKFKDWLNKNSSSKSIA